MSKSSICCASETGRTEPARRAWLGLRTVQPGRSVDAPGLKPASVPRGRACVAFGLSRLARADLDGRGHRRLWKVVEATRGDPLLAEAEASALGGSRDLADAIEFELRESEVVGRACAGERLPEQAVLGLVRGELGRVARVR